MRKIVWAIVVLILVLAVFTNQNAKEEIKQIYGGNVKNPDENLVEHVESIFPNSTTTTTILIEENIIALVNGKPITSDELDKQYTALPEEYHQIISKDDLLDRLIGYELLKQNAKNVGIEITNDEIDKVIDGIREDISVEEFQQNIELEYPTYNTFRNELKDTILIQKYVQNNVIEYQPTENELIEIYEQYKDSKSYKTQSFEELKPFLEFKLFNQKQQHYSEEFKIFIEELKDDAEIKLRYWV